MNPKINRKIKPKKKIDELKLKLELEFELVEPWTE